MRENLKIKNAIIEKVYGGEPFNAEQIIDEYSEYAKRLTKHVTDVNAMIHDAVDEGNVITSYSIHYTKLYELRHRTKKGLSFFPQLKKCHFYQIQVI